MWLLNALLVLPAVCLRKKEPGEGKDVPMGMEKWKYRCPHSVSRHRMQSVVSHTPWPLLRPYSLNMRQDGPQNRS